MNAQRRLGIAAVALLLLGLGAAGGYWFAASKMSHGTAPKEEDTAAVAQGSGQRKVLYWYDPMSPQQHFDKPGKSPFMDMPLQPKYADEADNVGGVRIDPNLIQNTGVRLARAEMGRLDDAVEVSGSLAYNERDVTIVQARTSGIVERVYARAPNDVVEEGAALADVRVPEWYSAQSEFIALSRSGDATLVAASRDRLVQLGMSPALIAQLERTGTPQPVVTISFRQRGVLQELGVREGMTVMQGQMLARINGLSSVWLDAEVPEAQAGGLAVGTSVTATLAAWPNRPYSGRIAALLPEVNRDARTVRVRAEISNPDGNLRPGMFARVRIGGGAGRETLVVPSEAVISTGMRQIVIVSAEGGRFRPAAVKIGRERNGKTEVLTGLSAGEQVVTSGQFLIDSEASLKGVLARMEQRAAPDEAAVLHQAQGQIRDLTPTEITVAHGPIPSLKWGAMTMSFRIADPAVTQGLKTGDSVRFAFRQVGDEFVVERVQKAEGGL